MYTQEDRSSDDYTPTAQGHDSGGADDYNPDHYTQREINYGQRRINYALTVVDKKLAAALQALKAAIAATPGCGQIDFRAVDAAIADVYATNERVAGIKPPGCDPSWS
jgi:hypothetical protein